jgi:Uma2 family endonuclease
VVLQQVSWEQYEHLGYALRDRPAWRLTYDQGTLEIGRTSEKQERDKKLAARLLETLAEEFGLSILPAGSMTFKREDLKRGLEPDECYWIANEPRMRRSEQWDPSADPPPDLVIEVEVTRSTLPRMRIYASLGVPEVWRLGGGMLIVELLQPDGSYTPSSESPTFPGFPVGEIPAFLARGSESGYLATVRDFRDRVQELLRRPSGR